MDQRGCSSGGEGVAQVYRTFKLKA
ncbi:unnamed protein product [Chondrus crispus]|uniref:Uncharacterized protein n=1 Tax=Chondrus crispus TaxID=2769 RepID=R7QFG4_CHOCR|nr:unnamed protein product [Chondrus crispus]CDF37272.1 unnamed protein product [Chondrus crispus]|eukprot:XP_005717091.1 unnamed protein product [Chondrus crispus]